MDEYLEALEGIKREGQINHELLDGVMCDHLKHSAQVIAGIAVMDTADDARLLEAVLGNPT